MIEGGLKEHFCTKCDFKTIYIATLNRHNNSIHLGIIIKHPCGVCKYEANSVKNLKVHISSQHEEKKFSCEKCSYSASSQTNLHRHNLSVHLKIRRFSCDQCEYKSFSRGKLKRHIKAKHEGIWFKCKNCDYHTKTEKALEFHMSMEHNESRSVSCTLCEFKTVNNGMLKKHTRFIHTSDDKKPIFTCKLCEYKSEFKIHVEKHKRLSHKSVFTAATELLDIKDELFKCKPCNLTFSKKRFCMRHIKEEHLGIKLNPIEGNKKVKCPECKRVVSKKGLKRHIQRDCPKTGVKTTSRRPVYSCNTCDFTTTIKLFFKNTRKFLMKGKACSKRPQNIA